MMADGIDFDLSELFKGIEFVSDRVQEAAERGMMRAMDDLSEETNRRAPKLTGELRASRKVKVTTTKYSVIGEVTYSAIAKNKRGWAFNYALRLHEMPYIKDPNTPGTGPKFLSVPLKSRSLKYEQMIADEIRKELT